MYRLPSSSVSRVLPSGTVTLASEVQPARAPSPKEVSEADRVSEVSAEQSSNACAPILVTLSGITISVSEEQSAKASAPTVRVFAESVTASSCAQPRKQPSGMAVTEERSPQLCRRTAFAKAYSPMLRTFCVRLMEASHLQL